MRCRLGKGFWLGKYEVTQGQWQAVMKTTPWSGNKQYVQSNSSHPAVYISYNDVQAFIQKLNDAGSAVYRLPTEAGVGVCVSGGHDDPVGLLGMMRVS